MSWELEQKRDIIYNSIMHVAFVRGTGLFASSTVLRLGAASVVLVGPPRQAVAAGALGLFVALPHRPVIDSFRSRRPRQERAHQQQRDDTRHGSLGNAHNAGFW